MKNIHRLLLSFLSALMLSAGWLGMGGWFLLGALVPLMVIERSYGSEGKLFWRIYGWVALAFGLWSGLTTWWIWHAAAIGAILSVIITCLLMGGVFMLFHYVRRRAKVSLAYLVLVCGWIAAEYLYTVGEVSFPWLTLGNGFARDIKLVQWYEFTGVFGGSLWVLISNIAIYEALMLRRRHLILTASLVVLLPALLSITRYYTYEEEGHALKVTVVQPNIDPYKEKFVTMQQEQTKLLLDLAQEAPADVDFIVMPETAIEEGIWENSIESSPSILALRSLIKERYQKAQIIVGATTFRYYDTPSASPTARQGLGSEYWYDLYNTSLAIDTSAHTQVRHKSKLVVGAEKMPYYSVLKHLEFLIVDLGGITGQHGTDPYPATFTSQTGRITAAAVCFESIYGGYMSGFIERGAQLLFVITNDGWWHDTPGYRQHFSFSRLRAVEMRRDVARSANTGISGIINQRGDVVESLGWEKRGTLTGAVHSNNKITFYARYGDVIGRVACYVLALSMLYFIAYRIRRRNHFVK